MIYARPKIPPTRTTPKSSRSTIPRPRAVPGYIKSLALDDPSGTVPGWVMVYADSFIAASRAADLVKVEWRTPEAARISEQDLQRHAAQLIADTKGGALVVDDPGVDAAFAAAKQTLERTYTTSTVMHFQLEPMNAPWRSRRTACLRSTPAISGSRWSCRWLAKALGRSQDTIVLRTYMLGGGFGRRLNGDYAVPLRLPPRPSASRSRWSARDPTTCASIRPRSPSVQLVRMAFGEGGKVTAMDHQAAAGWPTAVMAPSFMSKDKNGVRLRPLRNQRRRPLVHGRGAACSRIVATISPTNASGQAGCARSGRDGPTGRSKASWMRRPTPLASIRWRFGCACWTAPDAMPGSAPNAVGGRVRQAAVLAPRRRESGLGGAMPKDTGLGVATSFGQERDMPTWVACAARVRVDRASGRVMVEKLTLVVDAGTIVHPDSAQAQVEGAALWGLSMALHEGSEFVKGQPKDTNLDTYTPLRMGDMPEIEVELLPAPRRPLVSASRRRPWSGPRLPMRFSPPQVRACVICRSARTPCGRRSTPEPSLSLLIGAFAPRLPDGHLYCLLGDRRQSGHYQLHHGSTSDELAARSHCTIRSFANRIRNAFGQPRPAAVDI